MNILIDNLVKKIANGYIVQYDYHKKNEYKYNSNEDISKEIKIDTANKEYNNLLLILKML